MLFRKKKPKDEVLEEAIDFIEFQINTIKNLNINSENLKCWSRIYNNILDLLKSMRK